MLLQGIYKIELQILVTSRCNISQYETIKISEMDADTELIELFYKHCPSAKSSQDVVKEIIQTVGCHTLTVCLVCFVSDSQWHGAGRTAGRD